MNVYVLIMEAVYDQGCCGVFSTLEGAIAHARELWNKSDGYHAFRVETMKVDQILRTDMLSLKGWDGAQVANPEELRLTVKDRTHE